MSVECIILFRRCSTNKKPMENKGKSQIFYLINEHTDLELFSSYIILTSKILKQFATLQNLVSFKEKTGQSYK